jgi:hypothetical protein
VFTFQKGDLFMKRNICYHTRAYGNNSVKLFGGTFDGGIDQETVERLTRLFSVTVKNSGTVVFVDRKGREVYLYLSVDASETAIGKAALAAWRAERARLQAEQEEMDRANSEEIDELMSGLTHDEVVRRLKGESL